MKKLILILIAILTFSPVTSAKDNKDIEEKEGLSYEIEGAGIGSQGTYLVTVTVISKKSNIDDDLIARCAIHGVLFRGFSNNELRIHQKPLTGSAMTEAQHADFFKDFFKKNGLAKNYVASINNSRQVVKSGKQYKISTIVTVNKELLHSDLEKAGIIKGLNTGF